MAVTEEGTTRPRLSLAILSLVLFVTFLDNTIVLAPNREWVASLPNAKLPDRTDFTRYGTELKSRMTAWTTAASASAQMADEFQQWLDKPDPAQVEPL